MQSGGCQCGTARYAIEGAPIYSALCHCADCRASSGAPAVAWMAVREDQLTLTSGQLTTYEGRNGSYRQFCPTCGTGLFFRNQNMLAGLVDVQAATLDDSAAGAPELQVQCAERLSWMTKLGELPDFERYPGPP